MNDGVYDVCHRYSAYYVYDDDVYDACYAYSDHDDDLLMMYMIWSMLI